jgi:hypothetical protein
MQKRYKSSGEYHSLTFSPLCLECRPYMYLEAAFQYKYISIRLCQHDFANSPTQPTKNQKLKPNPILTNHSYGEVWIAKSEWKSDFLWRHWLASYLDTNSPVELEAIAFSPQALSVQAYSIYRVFMRSPIPPLSLQHSPWATGANYLATGRALESLTEKSGRAHQCFDSTKNWKLNKIRCPLE